MGEVLMKHFQTFNSSQFKGVVQDFRAMGIMGCGGDSFRLLGATAAFRGALQEQFGRVLKAISRSMYPGQKSGVFLMNGLAIPPGRWVSRHPYLKQMGSGVECVQGQQTAQRMAKQGLALRVDGKTLPDGRTQIVFDEVQKRILPARSGVLAAAQVLLCRWGCEVVEAALHVEAYMGGIAYAHQHQLAGRWKVGLQTLQSVPCQRKAGIAIQQVNNRISLRAGGIHGPCQMDAPRLSGMP